MPEKEYYALIGYSMEEYGFFLPPAAPENKLYTKILHGSVHCNCSFRCSITDKLFQMARMRSDITEIMMSQAQEYTIEFERTSDAWHHQPVTYA